MSKRPDYTIQNSVKEVLIETKEGTKIEFY